MTSLLPAIAFVACAISVATAQQSPRTQTWLDRPLVNWNQRSTSVPRAGAPALGAESASQAATRCRLESRRTTAGERALVEAGWIPFLHVDRQIVQRDVEIVGGMAAADGMCRPASFNVFVFVAGHFAGTLSPESMTSRLDGSIGAVRLSVEESIAAEFARFRDEDALCCPSSRVTVRYRIDRTGPQPAVVPDRIVTTRP